jgi:beta-hydroxylase
MKGYVKLHYKILGRNSYLGLEQLIKKRSLVGDKTFFDKEQFPWVQEMEANWQVIRQELNEVMKDRENIPNFLEVSPDQKKIDAEQGKWKTFFLYGYGYKIENNINRCPETSKLVEKIPGMKTAFFSILAPGKHIPPHRGPYAGVLRYHLGLIVPEPKNEIKIRVGNDYSHWDEGKSLIFDDTYEHEVWNNADNYRVVLFVDFVRPLNGFTKKINDWLINAISKSPLVQEGLKNMEKLSERKIAAKTLS